MRAEFIPLDGGSALRVDAPDGGATLVVQRDDGLHAVADLSPAAVRALRASVRRPWNAPPLTPTARPPRGRTT